MSNKGTDYSDLATGFIKRAMDILFVQNPKGTGMGVLFGAVLDGATKLFAPALKTLRGVDFTNLNIFYYIVVGAFLFNVRNLFKRHKFDQSVEDAIAMIEETARKQGLSKTQKKMMYAALCNQLVDRVRLDPATQKKADALASAGSKVPENPA